MAPEPIMGADYVWVLASSHRCLFLDRCVPIMLRLTFENPVFIRVKMAALYAGYCSIHGVAARIEDWK